MSEDSQLGVSVLNFSPGYYKKIRGQRFAAACIDLVFLIVVVAASVVFVSSINPGRLLKGLDFFIYFYLPISIFVLSYIFMQTLFVFLFSATLGKLIFQLRVLKRDNSRLSITDAFKREAVKNLPIASLCLMSALLFEGPIYAGVGGLLILGFVLYQKKKAREGEYLHEIWSSTRVVEVKKLEGIYRFISVFFHFFFFIVFIFYLWLSFSIFSVPLEHNRLLYAQDQKIRNDVGGLETTLENYMLENGVYPGSLNILLESGEFKKLPRQPGKSYRDDGDGYEYIVSLDGSSASIAAKLKAAKGYWCWNSRFEYYLIAGRYQQKAKEVNSEKECRI